MSPALGAGSPGLALERLSSHWQLQQGSLPGGWVVILCCLLDYKGFPLPWSVKIFSLIKIGIPFLYFFMFQISFSMFFLENMAIELWDSLQPDSFCVCSSWAHTCPWSCFLGYLPLYCPEQWFQGGIFQSASLAALENLSDTHTHTHTHTHSVPLLSKFQFGMGWWWLAAYAFQGILKHAGLTGLL